LQLFSGGLSYFLGTGTRLETSKRFCRGPLVAGKCVVISSVFVLRYIRGQSTQQEKEALLQLGKQVCDLIIKTVRLVVLGFFEAGRKQPMANSFKQAALAFLFGTHY
jgi:hypothetical protein